MMSKSVPSPDNRLLITSTFCDVIVRRLVTADHLNAEVSRIVGTFFHLIYCWQKLLGLNLPGPRILVIRSHKAVQGQIPAQILKLRLRPKINTKEVLDTITSMKQDTIICIFYIRD